MATKISYRPKKSREYWAARNEASLTHNYDNALNVESYMTNLYKKSLIDIVAKYNNLMKPYILANGEVDLAELNKAKQNLTFIAKVQRLETEINLMSQKLNATELKQVTELLTTNYEYTVTRNYEAFGLSESINILNADAVQQAIKTPWTKDGAEFSTRIWRNTTNMDKTLRNTLSYGIANGESLDKTARKFREVMGNTTANSKRIIRTETSAIYNRANINSYEELGASKIEYIAEADACDICAPHDGERINLSDAVVGNNIPPLHPNCRCSFIPISRFEE